MYNKKSTRYCTKKILSCSEIRGLAAKSPSKFFECECKFVILKTKNKNKANKKRSRANSVTHT